MNYQSRRIGDDGGEVSRYDVGERLLYEADRVGVYGALSIAWLADVARMRSGTGLLQRAYDISGKNNDLSQATVDPRPVDPFFGEPVFFSFGGSGDYASTPDPGTVSNVCLICRVAENDMEGAASYRVAQMATAGNYAYALFRSASTRRLVVRVSQNGTDISNITCDEDLPAGLNGVAHWEMAIVGLGSPWTARFFYALSNSNTVPDFASWTELATEEAHPTDNITTIRDSANVLEVGSYLSGSNGFAGRIYRAQVRPNGFASDPIADFRASDFPHLGDTAEDSCGNTWTRNGTGTYMLRQHEGLFNGAHWLDKDVAISTSYPVAMLTAAYWPAPETLIPAALGFADKDVDDQQAYLSSATGLIARVVLAGSTVRIVSDTIVAKQQYMMEARLISNALRTLRLNSGAAIEDTAVCTHPANVDRVSVGRSADSTPVYMVGTVPFALVLASTGENKLAAIRETINQIRQVY
jgi:hypothetical protein